MITDEDLIQRLRDLSLQYPKFGYRRLHALILSEGHKVNHKRIQRLYRQENLDIGKRTIVG